VRLRAGGGNDPDGGRTIKEIPDENAMFAAMRRDFRRTRQPSMQNLNIGVQ
jgi:hypothetical protein